MQQTQGTVGTGIYQAVRLDKQIGIVRARAAGQAAQAEQQEEVMHQFHVGVSLFGNKDTIFLFPTDHIEDAEFLKEFSRQTKRTVAE